MLTGKVMTMDIGGAVNRGNNLLMSGPLAVLGFGLIPQISGRRNGSIGATIVSSLYGQ